MHRSLRLGLSLLAVVTVVLATGGTSYAHQAGTTFMKVKAAHGNKPHGSANLFYHGGAIEQNAAVYIVYWGSEWSTGFGPNGHTSADAQNYVEGFFNGVGGSMWANSTKQYCSGVATGTIQCGTSGTHPTNPANELAGHTWVDTSSVPTSPTQNQIAAEAARLASHFNGVQPDADYMVFTPTGHSESGFGTQWCAYHSSSGNLSYSYMPYQPDAGASCGMNFVNNNGYFDGFSIVGGHEYAETVTDPYPNSGWLDSRGAENGDKCAWLTSGPGAAANTSFTTGSFAVQSLWSNLAGGCVISS
ncbi:MAG: hypothetical protein E6I61_00145 [Chloroflexi bacterium]|nr:MAG: hypothetical protein E6I61_00145 [Chloroflexota bacterium]